MLNLHVVCSIAHTNQIYKMTVGRSPSIRSRLALLIVGCLTPALGLTALLIYYDYHRAQEQLVRNSMMTARAMASVIDSDLASIISSLHSLATSPYLSSRDLAAFDRQARDVLRHQMGDNIVLSNFVGKQYINTLRPYGDTLPQRNIPTPLKKMTETGEPTISNLFVGPVFHRPAIAVGVPVHHDGKYIYSLSTGIFAERFARILHQQNLPPDWIGVILDGNGTIVARTHDMDRFVGAREPQNVIAHIVKAKEGAFDGHTLDEIPVLIVFSRSAVSNWTVAIGIPKKRLVDELWRTLSWLIVAAVALFASSLGVAWFLGGRIARSVRSLTGPALALGAGEEVVVPPLHLKEADEVGVSLLRASHMLLQARHQANHDALTGLPNRTLFTEILDRQLALCQRNSSHLSLLYIDLDGFKGINDRHGHATGDKLLRAVADRLKAGIRASDLAARLGGDEFAVILVDATVNEAAEVAGKLVESLSMPCVIDELTVEISASIGIAGFPGSGSNAKELLHGADDAMYEAKAKGKRCVAIQRKPSSA